MGHLQLDCPHCSTEKAGFQGNQYLACNDGSNSYLILLQCGVCQNGIVAKGYGGALLGWVNGTNRQLPAFLGFWPGPKKIAVPDYLPANVNRFFAQGLDSLQRNNFDAAGTMFRKALEVSLKVIHLEGSGNLQRRINSLPVDLGITPAMKQWAHEIRALGNDAAHEEEPFTEAEAKALHGFTETFLTYAFSLPGMLTARKAAEPPV